MKQPKQYWENLKLLDTPWATAPLRLEKVVASKQLRLALETEEERRTRLEVFLKSWQLCLSLKLDVLTTRHPQLKEI